MTPNTESTPPPPEFHSASGRPGTTSPLFPVLLALVLAITNCHGSGSTFVVQDLAWTVTGTATESWTTTNVIQTTGRLSHNSGIGSDTATVTAGLDGTASVSFRLSAYHSGLVGAAYANVRIADTTGGRWEVLFLRSLSFNRDSGDLNGEVQLPVRAGRSYTFEVSSGAEFGSASATIDWKVPNRTMQQNHAAVRTATGHGLGQLDASGGEVNLGGFYAPPLALNAGKLTGLTYRLAADNPLVRVMFSDTRSQTTGNPNAAIIAITQPAPALLAAPESRTVAAGEAVTWSVTVTGESPLSYQWLFRGEPIAGATDARFRLESVRPEDAGDYAVRVSNPLGTVTSDPALLTVSPKPADPTTTAGVRIETVTLGGDRAFLEGSGGRPGSAFLVLTRASCDDGTWQEVASGTFGTAGRFLVSVPAGGSTRFWKLKLP